VQGIAHPDGEEATARAAAATNVPFIMSTASTRSIEDVAHANGNGPRWYQLYWYVSINESLSFTIGHLNGFYRPINDDVTLSILSRAKAAGFTALAVTLDTMSIGWRPHDLDSAYLPFFYSVGGQVGYSDPVFMKRFGLEPNGTPPSFPFEPKKMDEAIAKGDEATKKVAQLGRAFLGEVNSVCTLHQSFLCWLYN
jgi:lactate 2-monooxygenase